MIIQALAKEREGAGRDPCGLRNSELGSLPQKKCLICKKKAKIAAFLVIIPIWNKFF